MAINAPITPGHTFASGDELSATLMNKAFSLSQAQVPAPIGVADGGTGSTTAATAQAALQVKGRLEAWVQYSDNNTAKTIGTLPEYSYVTSVHVQVTTAFNAGGTDLLEVGWASDNDALMTSLDISTTGVKSTTLGANNGYNATSQAVKAYYIGGGAAPSTGKALVVIEYFQVTAQP